MKDKDDDCNNDFGIRDLDKLRIKYWKKILEKPNECPNIPEWSKEIQQTKRHMCMQCCGSYTCTNCGASFNGKGDLIVAE